MFEFAICEKAKTRPKKSSAGTKPVDGAVHEHPMKNEKFPERNWNPLEG
jgi:hypothetical protein